jgi:hypothetical protein
MPQYSKDSTQNHSGTTRRVRRISKPPTFNNSSLGSLTEETEEEVTSAPAPPPRTSHTLSKRDSSIRTKHNKTIRIPRTKGGPVLGYTPNTKYYTIAEGGRRRRKRKSVHSKSKRNSKRGCGVR